MEVHISDMLNGLIVFHVANQPVTRTSPCAEAYCSHICTIGPLETFKCLCPAGMQLTEDRKICTQTDDTTKLVVASEGAFKTTIIGSIKTEEWEVTHLDPKITSITDIVYNPVNHTLILSDSASKRIYEYSLSSKKLGVRVEGHMDKVQSVDIDVVGENLYWADSGKNTIEVMSLRTSARGIIMRNLTNIRDIVVEPDTSSLYVLTRDAEESKIYTMLLAGGNSSVIQQAHKPVALSYQHRLGRILWLEHTPKAHYKWVFKFDANSKVVYIWGMFNGPPSDIIKFGNFVYYVYGQSIHGFSVQSMWRRSLPKMQLGSFDRNSSLMQNVIEAKMTIIDRNLSRLEDLMTHHDCGKKNPKILNCSHLCLLTGEKFVGICGCPEGMILGEDKITCTNLPTCFLNQFTCSSSNKCIPTAYICDGESDCEDDEDESNCQETTCTQAHFKCATSGKCIPGDWVCDEELDCVGGDDEFNCTRSCNTDGEFTCEKTKQCIPKSSRCDGVVDCLEDYSDERDCEVASCADHQLLCQSGLCIDKELMCNGIPNCGNAEDEVNCHVVVGEPTKKDIATSSAHNNNRTVVAVVVVVLLSFILIILPLGVFLVR